MASLCLSAPIPLYVNIYTKLPFFFVKFRVNIHFFGEKRVTGVGLRPAADPKNFGYADFYSNSAFRGRFIQQNWEIWEADTFTLSIYNLHMVGHIRVLLYMVFFEMGASKCGSIFLAILYKSANFIEFLPPKPPFCCNFCGTRTFLLVSTCPILPYPNFFAGSQTRK